MNSRHKARINDKVMRAIDRASIDILKKGGTLAKVKSIAINWFIDIPRNSNIVDGYLVFDIDNGTSRTTVNAKMDLRHKDISQRKDYHAQRLMEKAKQYYPKASVVIKGDTGFVTMMKKQLSDKK